MKFCNKMISLFIVTVAYLCTKVTAAPVPDMFLESLPESTSPGGKCMDGSMAGYYIREGLDQDRFVIFLKGGGACSTKEDCDKRMNGKALLASSENWEESIIGDTFLSGNCNANPEFCEATAVYIPYCTGDTHRGTKTEASDDTFGYYFDGHLNFQAIVESLIINKGLSDATHVLITGGSAGGIGSFFNVDWLNSRLDNAIVKAVPVAGWFSPGSLTDDLPFPHSPSDYSHFENGENGNELYDTIDSGVSPTDLWGMKEMLPSDCLASFSDDNWWACASMHVAYKYIKSSIFSVHSQYDSYQIYKSNGVPETPANDDEENTIKSYVEMWGNATRISLQQVVNDDVVSEKEHPDGVFSASCMLHGMNRRVTINGENYFDLVNDWFFQTGEKNETDYKLIESCTPLEGNENYVIPCNTESVCHYKRESKKKNKIKLCAQKLSVEGCLQAFGPRTECFACAAEKKNILRQAGCTTNMVQKICVYSEANDMGESLE